MRLPRLMLIAAALLCTVACSSRQEQAAETKLYFSNWDGEIAPGTLAGFRSRSGVEVVMDEIVDNVTLETRLLTGHSGSDIVVPSANFLAPLIQAGALRKLDRTSLPNWRHLDPAMLRALESVDPGNQFGVPYLWGTIGFAYNTGAVQRALGREPAGNLGILFDPQVAARLEPCGIHWQDGGGWMLTDLALLYLGRDLINPKIDDLADVERLLLGARPHVRVIESTGNFRSSLAGGDLCLAVGNNGDMLQAQDIARDNGTGAAIRFVLPDEGVLMWVDVLVIPAGAAHPGLAHQFIDYLLEPQVIAEVTNATRFANANVGAERFIEASIRSNPAIYLTEEARRRMQLLPSESHDYARARSRMWTRVVSGR